MPITVNLTADTERKLRERASQVGQDVAALARELIERAIDTKPSLDEILAPFRRQVAESGVTDDELTALFDEARSEAWRAKEQ
jgi:hypothetical protein